MLTIFARSVVLYAAAVMALRLMGKRQVGQLQPFELAVVIMISELAATPMGSVGIPLLYGFIPMAALLMSHGFITWLSGKSPRVDAIISGEPTVLIRGGCICAEALRKMGLSMTDLLEAVRVGGQMDISEVSTAVMEPSGRITVFAKTANRPVTMKDMHLHAAEETLPLPLIMDGQVHLGNLHLAGLTDHALRAMVAAHDLGSVRDVLLLLRRADGGYHAQTLSGRVADWGGEG